MGEELINRKGSKPVGYVCILTAMTAKKILCDLGLSSSSLAQIIDGEELPVLKMFKAGLRGGSNHTVCRGGGSPIQIVQIHHFALHLKRIAVVIRIEEQFYAFVKGAPETIQGRLNDTLAFYVSIYKRYTRQGSRVLALAYKPLPDMTGSSGSGLTLAILRYKDIYLLLSHSYYMTRGPTKRVKVLCNSQMESQMMKSPMTIKTT